MHERSPDRDPSIGVVEGINLGRIEQAELVQLGDPNQPGVVREELCGDEVFEQALLGVVVTKGFRHHYLIVVVVLPARPAVAIARQRLDENAADDHDRQGTETDCEWPLDQT